MLLNDCIGCIYSHNSEINQIRIQYSSDTTDPLLCKICYIPLTPLLKKHVSLEKLIVRLVMEEKFKGVDYYDQS